MEKIGIWNDFKSNHKISNQIQIKSHVFQIKSLFFKSNHYVWFNHDLNQIMIWICPSLPHTAAATTLCVTNRAGVHPIGRRLSLRQQILTSDKTVIRSPGLPFFGLHSRKPCNYYSFTDPEGMEGWVGLVGWPVAYILPTKWSHVNHR